MSEYYIELSDSASDRIHLSSSQVDTVNYDNNSGYDVYAVVICADNGEPDVEFDFATREARDAFIEDQELDYQKSEWKIDVESFEITVDDGSRQEFIPCKCDVEISYCI